MAPALGAIASVEGMVGRRVGCGQDSWGVFAASTALDALHALVASAPKGVEVGAAGWAGLIQVDNIVAVLSDGFSQDCDKLGIPLADRFTMSDLESSEISKQIKVIYVVGRLLAHLTASSKLPHVPTIQPALPTVPPSPIATVVNHFILTERFYLARLERLRTSLNAILSSTNSPNLP
ncbi:hypothetical protein B0H67DRAFT_641924 [Lasiosphaeris hirsuta]|uniref:Uncharacterized protein n=1 Tax=Lasiosphaeris hirsuta TaxID=260670 RepID=A0AA40B0P8_9PEZI|nr:hypothetical protein B0H67DRAFT_641924 [Lasiosphaeris hirsuta]